MIDHGDGTLMYPDNYLYSQEHEWVEVADDVCTVGITDFAQKELGEVVFVELPEVGATFDAGDELGTIESVKAVSEIYAPVAGEVIEVNDDLEDAPEKVNEGPHDDGWLVKIRLTTPADLESLMSAEAYQEMTESGD